MQYMIKSIMVYIIVALLAEAKSIIKKYKLSKREDNFFLIFENNQICLIISGIGKINSSIATTYIISKIKESDLKIINLGMCTSKNINSPIGEFIYISKLIDKSTNNSYHLHHKNGSSLTCVDQALNSSSTIKSEFADMESIGFYLSAKKFINIENIYIIKVVSDILDDRVLKNDFINSIFEKNIDKISEYID